MHLVVDLLDFQSRREWESAISDTTDPPSYAELIQFLDRRLHTLESLLPSRTESSYAKPETSSGRLTRVLHSRRPDGQGGRCTMCNQEYHILFCNAFKAKTASERRKHVGANQLCFNCLRRHWVCECPSEKTCSSCSERHHTLLHDAGDTHEVARASLSAARSAKAAPAVLLATARVRVVDKFGTLHAVRALVDQGSKISLVAESLAQHLQLARATTSTSIVGLGGRFTGVRGQVELALTPLRDGPLLQVSAFVLDRLTKHNGGLRADRQSWRHLDGLKLADPDFFASDPVELLLGADVCAGILQPGFRRGGPRQSVAQQTTLDWILSGTVGVTAAGRSAHTCPASRSPKTSQGRRASQALLACDERRLVTAPRSSHLTRVIVEAWHRRTFHGDVQLTLGSSRQQLWSPRGRRLAKAASKQCVTCARWRAVTQQRTMGDLPCLRVAPAGSSLRTGMDHAGLI